jgi:hypothetical protein
MLRSLVLAALATAALALPAGAQPPDCSRETLDVRGSPVTIQYCLTGTPHETAAGELIVPVAADYSAPTGSYRSALELHFVAEEGVSRVLQSLDLSKLGLSGTLHLTLAYVHGTVRVDGALLTPGAITIK